MCILGDFHHMGYRNTQAYVDTIFRDEEKSIKYYTDAALYSTKAQFKLGERYMRKDEKVSEMWFKKSIEYDAENQYKYGSEFVSALRRSRDFDKAFYYLEKSAKQGHPKAQIDLGEMYCKGWGTDVDKTEGFKWFYKSAQNGCIDAQRIVSDCYQSGNGVSQNYDEAYRFLHMSISLYDRSESENVQQEERLMRFLYTKLRTEKEVRKSIDVSEVLVELIVGYAIRLEVY